MKTKNFSKVVVFLLAFFVCNVPSLKAQDVLMATLQSGDNMEVFYGANAFQKALEAANDGDQITLNGGTFKSCDITKAVKIFGAGGFVQDAENNRYKTVLNDALTIELPSGVKGLHIEGINFPREIIVKGTIEEMTLKRNYLNWLNLSKASVINSNIIQCQIQSFWPDQHSKNLTLANSIFYINNPNAEDAVLYILNCLQLGGNYGYPNTAVYKSCIINNCTDSSNVSYYDTAYTYQKHTGHGYSRPSTTATMDGCIDLGEDFKLDNLFEDGYFSPLKEEWLMKFTCVDGQWGIHGGRTPFTNVPSNPQIVSKQIAKESDSDGKLSVKITVEAQK